MDFARLAQYFALDVLGKVTFGTAFGYLGGQWRSMTTIR
jgi:hypothetical protein